MEEGGTESEEC